MTYVNVSLDASLTSPVAGTGVLPDVPLKTKTSTPSPAVVPAEKVQVRLV